MLVYCNIIFSPISICVGMYLEFSRRNILILFLLRLYQLEMTPHNISLPLIKAVFYFICHSKMKNLHDICNYSQ